MRKGRVLIVDDEREYALALAERLGLRGYETKVLFCSDDLLREIAREAYDIILLDLLLEGESGMDLLRKTTGCSAGCCVIVMTGVADERVCRAAAAEGAVDLLVKPVDINVLIERIELALRGHSNA